jgi:hypothetical protein
LGFGSQLRGIARVGKEFQRNAVKKSNETMETQRLKEVVAARMAAAVERLAPETSSDHRRARNRGRAATRMGGTTRVPAARSGDHAAGSRLEIEPSVRRAVFFDFLDMAASLLEEADRLSAATSAAFLAGATLEEYLRKLADANGVDTVNSGGERVGAESLNTELCRAGVYDLSEQMLATAWLDLRNKADLGKRYEFTAQEVRLMIQGVREFMIRHRE